MGKGCYEMAFEGYWRCLKEGVGLEFGGERVVFEHLKNVFDWDLEILFVTICIGLFIFFCFLALYFFLFSGSLYFSVFWLFTFYYLFCVFDKSFFFCFFGS